MTKYRMVAVCFLVALLRANHVGRAQLQVSAAPPAAYVDRLLEIEQRVNPPTLVDGPAAHATLHDYYRAANPEIERRFAQARAAYLTQPHRPVRSVTLIAGDAGVGKTFIKGAVMDKSFGREGLFKCDLHELYNRWQKAGIVEQRSDLRSGDVIINRLPALRRPGSQPLKKLLAEQDASFYVIDSLDEIHPDDYVSTLRQVVEFACNGNRPFTHIVVFGRPFAFREYWQTCRQEYQHHDVELHLLHPPEFRTTGDLLVSTWNYHTWKYKLKMETQQGRLVTMPLSDYEVWYKTGFKRTGRFASVRCVPNDDMNPDVQRALVELARHDRDVIPMLQNLAGNSILREIVRENRLQGLRSNSRTIHTPFLKAWMDRERIANDRPAQSDPEHLDLYVELLSRIARHYLAEGKLDEDGFFEIHPADQVCVEYGGRAHWFPVERAIIHSGLKQIDPRLPEIPKYRFYPIWIHRVLIEQNHQQLAALD